MRLEASESRLSYPNVGGLVFRTGFWVNCTIRIKREIIKAPILKQDVLNLKPPEGERP